MCGCLQVFQRILWADKALAAPLVPGLLNAVAAALETHHYPACLDTLSIAVAEYGSSPAHATRIKEAFCRACNAVSPFLLVRPFLCTNVPLPLAPAWFHIFTKLAYVIISKTLLLCFPFKINCIYG